MKEDILVFVPDLGGKASSFLPLSMLLAVETFVDTLYEIEEVPLYSRFANSSFFFSISGYCILSVFFLDLLIYNISFL